MAMFDLTAFQRDMLVCIAGTDEEESYGLNIKKSMEADDMYGEDVNHGRLYPNLDELVEKGLVTKSSMDRRTNKYTITQKGLEVITAHREWQADQLPE